VTGIPLSALLAHPRWSDVRDLTVLGADPDVGAAQIVRDLRRDIEPARGGLLVVLYSADRHDWRLDTVLGRSADAGIGAVVLEGTKPLLSSTLALARRLQMPVLGTPDPLSAYRSFERLCGEGDLELAELTLRALRFVAEAGSAVDDALVQITAALGRPVAVVDAQGALVAGDLHGHGLIGGVQPRGLSSRANQLRLPLADGALLLAHRLRLSGAHAWLAVWVPAPVDTELRALETAMLAVTPAVEHRLALARMTLERSARRRASVLDELLHPPITPATRRRCLDLGWELEGWHTGVHVGVPHDIDLAGRRVDVVAAFEGEQLPAVVVEHGDGWAVWVTTMHEPTVGEVQATASAIRRVHRRLRATLDVHVGVGRPHPGPEGIARTVTEAGDAARLARGRAESGKFLHVDRLGLAQLLLAWTGTDTFEPAAQSLLAPLAEASGELITTLSAYLDAESSLTETAAVLGVHRNTVGARIARIEALLGVDLSVPDDRLALHLACRTVTRRRDEHAAPT
jgi:PucR family transcriptional regulator, purine catabolism regulatory protein